jgi:hypothetical protein
MEPRHHDQLSAGRNPIQLLARIPGQSLGSPPARLRMLDAAQHDGREGSIARLRLVSGRSASPRRHILTAESATQRANPRRRTGQQRDRGVRAHDAAPPDRGGSPSPAARPPSPVGGREPTARSTGPSLAHPRAGLPGTRHRIRRSEGVPADKAHGRRTTSPAPGPSRHPNAGEAPPDSGFRIIRSDRQCWLAARRAVLVQHDDADVGEPRSCNPSKSVCACPVGCWRAVVTTVSSDLTGSRTHLWASLRSGVE